MTETRQRSWPRPLEEVLADAAAEVRERMGRDAQRFADDEGVRRLCKYLDAHLFDTGLDVDSLLRDSGTSRDARDRFVAALGSLKTYTDERRIEVAVRLVRETDARFRTIARRTGFDVLRTFRRTFERVLGTTPRDVRREAREEAQALAAAAAEPAAHGEHADLESDAAESDAAESDNTPFVPDAELAPQALARRWRNRVALGACNARQADELLQRLRQLYPCLRDDQAQALPAGRRRPVYFPPIGDDELESHVAVEVLDRILRLPDEERRHALVHGTRFRLDTVFHALRQTSALLLEHDRDEALRLCELSVEVAEAYTDKLGAAGADWRARAWSDLGRRRLEAGDAAGAEQALTFAWAEWETPRDQTQPLVEARLCRLDAKLKKRRRRYGEAAKMLDRAIEICRSRQGCEDLAVTCLMERADLAAIGGEETSTALFDELGAGTENNPFAEATVLFFRARTHAAAGRDDEAASCFAAARELSRRWREMAPDHPDLAAAHRLLDGQLARDEGRFRRRRGELERAARRLRAAVEHFTAVPAAMLAGVARAELAAICFLRGERAEAAGLAAEAAAFLDSLPLHREARRAGRILAALADGDVAEAGAAELLAELGRALELVVREVSDSDLVGAGEEMR